MALHRENLFLISTIYSWSKSLDVDAKVDDDKITSSGLNWSSIPITGSNTSTSPDQRKKFY